MAPLKLFLFGPPRLERAGRPLTISRRKVLAMLGYLAATCQPHGRDALATLLWPESGQRTARGNLRRTLYRLTQAAGDDLLAVSADTISLNPQADLWLDVDQGSRLVEAALPSQPPANDLTAEALSTLAEAAVLYTADFLAGFTLPDCPEFDEWQFFQAEGLRQLLARVLEQLVCAQHSPLSQTDCTLCRISPVPATCITMWSIRWPRFCTPSPRCTA